MSRPVQNGASVPIGQGVIGVQSAGSASEAPQTEEDGALIGSLRELGLMGTLPRADLAVPAQKAVPGVLRTLALSNLSG